MAIETTSSGARYAKNPPKLAEGNLNGKPLIPAAHGERLPRQHRAPIVPAIHH
jgi:hypothetical protein